MARRSSPAVTPASQFNAGYHTGAANAKAGAMVHPIALCSHYQAGMRYGERDYEAGTYVAHALAAWTEYQAEGSAALAKAA